MVLNVCLLKIKMGFLINKNKDLYMKKGSLLLVLLEKRKFKVGGCI